MPESTPDELEALRLEIAVLNRAMGDSAKIQEALTKQLADTNRDHSKWGKSLIGKLVGFTSVAGFLADSFSKANALQKRSLALGSTFNKNLADNRVAMSNLTNGWTTFAVAADAMVAQQEAGFRGMSVPLSKLMIETKFSGGNMRKLANDMRMATLGLGLNSEEVGSLARQTRGLSQTFKVSNQRLIEGLNQLGQTFRDNMAIGGKNVQHLAAANKLRAVLGQQNDNLVNTIASFPQKLESMWKAPMMGISSLVTKLATGEGGPGDLIEMIKIAGPNMRAFAKSLGEDRRITIPIFRSIFGDAGIAMLQASDIMKELSANELAKKVQVEENFRKTMENFRTQVVNPLQEIFMKFSLALMNVFNSPIFQGIARMAMVIGGGAAMKAMGGKALTTVRAAGSGGILSGLLGMFRLIFTGPLKWLKLIGIVVAASSKLFRGIFMLIGKLVGVISNVLEPIFTVIRTILEGIVSGLLKGIEGILRFFGADETANELMAIRKDTGEISDNTPKPKEAIPTTNMALAGLISSRTINVGTTPAGSPGEWEEFRELLERIASSSEDTAAVATETGTVLGVPNGPVGERR